MSKTKSLAGSRIENLPIWFLPFFGAMAATGAFAMDMYLPAIPTMADDFKVNIVALNNTVSSFLIGYGLGQFFGGPISDQVGRKTVGMGGQLLFMAASLGIMLAANIQQVLILRTLQAFGAGMAVVICLASIRDAFEANEAGRKYAIVIMIMLIAPLIAPFIGALLLDFGWEMIFIVLFAFGASVALLYGFIIPETRIVEHKKIDFKSIFKQYIDVLKRKVDGKYIPVRYVLANSFCTGVLLVVLTNASFMYMEYFGLSEKMFPFYLGANVILMIFSIRYSMYKMKKVHPYIVFKKGLLIQLILCGLLLLVVMLGEPKLEIVFPLIVLTIGSLGLVSPNASAVYISYFDFLSGSASSVRALIVFAVGALMGVVSSAFFDGTLLPMALTMFACSVICFLIGQSIPKPTKRLGHH